MLSHWVVSNFLWPPRTVAQRAALSVGILQARILELTAMPSSKGSSQPRDWTQIDPNPGIEPITGGLFTIWASREAHLKSTLAQRQHLLLFSLASVCIPQDRSSHLISAWTSSIWRLPAPGEVLSEHKWNERMNLIRRKLYQSVLSGQHLKCH